MKCTICANCDLKKSRDKHAKHSLKIKLNLICGFGGAAEHKGLSQRKIQ